MTLTRPLLMMAAFGLILATATPAINGQTLREKVRERIADRAGKAGEDRPVRHAPTEYGYGSDPLQKLDFWAAVVPQGMPRAPLVIFVHGGGWKRGDKRNATGSAKVDHWLEQGYSVASLNYRLVPANTVEQQAQDVANAVAWLRKNAPKLGFDPDAVVLSGHSAGAHLVALVGTDERYLKEAGLSFAALRGVMPIDGACYDVPRQMREGGAFMGKTYEQAFSTDPERQRALSPYYHAQAPNVPDFLILHVQRPNGVVQAKELQAALAKAGTRAERQEFSGTGLKGHAEINRSLGDPDYPATPVVDEWLRQIFADR